MRAFDPLDLSHEHYVPRAEGSAEQPAGQHRHLRFGYCAGSATSPSEYDAPKSTGGRLHMAQTLVSYWGIGGGSVLRLSSSETP
jgi:hypothetical protein